MIIAITGNKSSGKDLTAKLIHYYFQCKKFDKIGFDLKEFEESRLNKSGFETKKFAFKLKKICSELINCKVEDFEDESFKNKNNIFGKTNRQLLQDVGESIKKSCGENVWVDGLFTDYRIILGGSGLNWIISDLRFLNETKAIKERDGIIIKVVRPSLGANTDEHRSETELQSIIPDFTLVNNDSIENLYEKICSILKSINL